MDLELAGKTAIVTGGSRGIGKAIGRELAREGVDLAIAARDRATLEVTASELRRETGRRIEPFTVATGDDDAVRQLVAGAVSALGCLDILVNCAARPGGKAPTPALDQTTDTLVWDELNVKVLGYLRCARAAAPHMIARG